MPDPSEQKLIADVSAAEGDINLNLRRVLQGFIAESGGPEKWGRALAKITQDPDVAVSSRVSLANNLLKLVGAYGQETQDDDDLLSTDQIKARLRTLSDDE